VIRNLGSKIEKLEREAMMVNGPERKAIETMVEDEWRKVDTITAEADVYARAKPEDKITIVRSLQRQGNVCSMTGDGVNDAPGKHQDMHCYTACS
jgi:magnesium-transporting ATPase (P-type)